MKGRTALAVFCALALLCAGVFAGRLSALRGGAVLRAENGGVPDLPALSAAAAPARAPAGTLDLNTATAAQLDELPGIGATLADRIVAYRTQNGPFRSTEELLAVEGIGRGILAQLDGLITVQ